VGTLVLTLGKKGSAIYHDGGTVLVPAAALERIDDPTGAGDAYRGGFFAARMAGLPLEVCGKVGALCSVYALEQMGTTAHRFTLDEFIARYAVYFGDEPSLELLRQPAQVAG
jgi:adenosine kinase